MSLAMAYFQESGGGGSLSFYIVLYAGLIAIFYFVVLRPQMRQQKDHQKLMDSLKKGDKIITNGGLWGEIDVVEAKAIRIKINDKTKVLISRSAVSGFQPQENGGETKT